MLTDSELRPDLEALASQDRLRRIQTYEGSDRIHLSAGGRALTSFCSNDYLGLAGHPSVVEAAIAALRRHGAGAGSSRLITGESPAHADLERALAQFLDSEAVLTFPTGYQANLGVLTALAGRDDLIASDAANHASIIDACRLSRARVAVYPHLDVAAAARALDTPGSFRRRILVTESLFSMDGDRAPLLALAALSRDHRALLVVDEAHALGVLGPRGRGLARQDGIIPDVTVGTLGKALGALGGFAATSAITRTFLLNHARQFIFTTSLPAAVASAAHRALELAASAEGDRLRTLLRARVDHLRALLAAMGTRAGGNDAIVPIVLGTDLAAVAASSQLLDRGVIVPAIRPPTVPEGACRLRITLSAVHSHDEVEALAAALLPALRPL